MRCPLIDPTDSQKHRAGAIMPMFAVFLPVILALGAFAINVAWMSLVDSELQIASDTAARAAGREFAVTQSLQSARDRAKQAVQKNSVGGKIVTLQDPQITFGESVLATSGPGSGSYVFTPRSVTQGTLGTGPGLVYVNSISIAAQKSFGYGDMPLPVPMLSSAGFTPAATSTSTQLDRDIVLVLDRSGSMDWYSSDPTSWYPAGPGQSYYGSRWRELATAVSAFNGIIQQTPMQEQVALATFSSTSSGDCPLSSSIWPIDDRMDQITNNFLGGATAIGDGIQSGTWLITDPMRARPAAKKTMIVMTDGNHNTGIDPIPAAQWAHGTFGVTIFTITFSLEADQAKMMEVASIGGGAHFHANTGSELQSVFEEIARTLPTMLTR